MYKIKREEQN